MRRLRQLCAHHGSRLLDESGWMRFLSVVMLGWLGCAPPPSSAPRVPPTVVAQAPESPPTGALATVTPMASAPLRRSRRVHRIAFGSCFAPQLERDQIWSAIIAQRPELFVFIGDNVYQRQEGDDPELLELRAAYSALADNRPFASLREQMPVLATWDDHDYGLNDAGSDFAPKRLSEQLFERAWSVPKDDPRALRRGVYGAFDLGPAEARVQLILLDTRFFRSPLRPTDQEGAPGKERYLPDPDPAKTMLGQAQWAWLEQTLRRPAAVRLLVSSIQVVADGHGWEGWYSLPRERERLYATIARAKAEGVIFISGDRHAAGIYQAPSPAPYPIVEMTTSSLNLPIDDPDTGVRLEPGPHRDGTLFLGENFGTVSINWQTRQIHLEVRDAQGVPVRRRTIAMDALRLGR